MASDCVFVAVMSRINAQAESDGLIQPMALSRRWPIQIRQGTAMALPMAR